MHSEHSQKPEPGFIDGPDADIRGFAFAYHKTFVRSIEERLDSRFERHSTGLLLITPSKVLLMRCVLMLLALLSMLCQPNTYLYLTSGSCLLY
jgi:hypothetical protein